MQYFCREIYFPLSRIKVFLSAHQGKLTHPIVYTNHSGRVWRRQDKEVLLHALTSRPFPLYSRAIRCETIRRLISAERARPDKARWTWCAPSSINCFEDTRRSRERFANSEKRRMGRLYAPHICIGSDRSLRSSSEERMSPSLLISCLFGIVGSSIVETTRKYFRDVAFLS